MEDKELYTALSVLINALSDSHSLLLPLPTYINTSINTYFPFKGSNNTLPSCTEFVTKGFKDIAASI